MRTKPAYPVTPATTFKDHPEWPVYEAPARWYIQQGETVREWSAPVNQRNLFRAFPKHTAGWSLDRMVTDGNHQPGQSQGPQHSAGWDSDSEKHDLHWIDKTPKGKHRRDAKHRGELDKYAHLSYAVKVA